MKPTRRWTPSTPPSARCDLDPNLPARLAGTARQRHRMRHSTNGHRLKGALVGYGFIGSRGHTPAYLARNDVDIVAVVDGCPERRALASELLPKARTYTSVRGAVPLAYPSRLHRYRHASERTLRHRRGGAAPGHPRPVREAPHHRRGGRRDARGPGRRVAAGHLPVPQLQVRSHNPGHRGRHRVGAHRTRPLGDPRDAASDPREGGTGVEPPLASAAALVRRRHRHGPR